MNVLIVDSNTDIVSRITELLNEQPRIEKVHGTIHFEEALGFFAVQRPHIVVLDMNLPDDQSFKLLEHMKIINARVFVVAISIYNDEWLVRRVLQQGANFFIDKYNLSEDMEGTMMSIATRMRDLQLLN